MTEEIIRFGKHKGKQYKNIPKDYLKWLIKQDWFQQKDEVKKLL